MKRVLYAAVAVLALDAVWAVGGAGCASDLSLTTPGHDKCDPSGQCEAGYTCVQGVCVVPGSPTSTTGGHAGSSGHGGHAGAGTSSVGTGGMGGAGTGGAASTTSTGGAGTGGHQGATSSTGTGGCGDTSKDPDNCGKCGNVCPKPVHGNGTPTCTAGACDVKCTDASDAGSFHSCPVNGGKDHVCVDQDDPQYCGSSCAACPGGQTCESGSCKAFCLPPLSSCGGVCVDLESDPANCGSCGNKCGGLTSGGAYCNAGACKGKPIGGTTGCDSTLLTCGSSPFSCSGPDDPFHCGSCGSVCGNTGLCANKSCETYIVASGSWECGNGNSLSNWCPPTGPVPYGLCTSGSACP